MLYVLGGGVSVEVLVALAGLWPKFMQGSLRKKVLSNDDNKDLCNSIHIFLHLFTKKL